MDPWLEEFSALGALTVREHEVGRRQRRTVEWGQQVYRDWFFRDLTDFAGDVLLTSARFRARMVSADPDAVVVNVRRGDYYSVPEYRQNYGFDVAAYVRAAIQRVPGGQERRIVLISDDIDWCWEHLSFLEEHGQLDALKGAHDMFEDLAQIAAGRDLILANSTFSYWGGYLASALPPAQRPRSVQAPLHFNRLYSYGESPLLLPQWRAVPDDEFVPGDRTEVAP